ncbi:MAG: hypothetical protein QXD03_02645 [Candidatus Anstonellales archaeon]
MVNNNTLAELERLGFGADIGELERYIEHLQDCAAMGKPEVQDSTYDHLVKLLKQLKPDSYVLNRNWEKDEQELSEVDELLVKYGMCSILTINSLDELDKFRELLREIGRPVELIASLKENGHACRAVYVYGHLHSGSTRGRYKKGRDITRHLKAVLPNYIEEWKNEALVEVRGEMLVSIENFNKYLKGMGLKTPLSSVTSLIRDSVTDDELKLLEMVCYKVLFRDKVLNSLWDEMEYLKALGFKTPSKAKIGGVTSNNVHIAVDRLLKYFEGLMDKGEVEYSTDGIVVAINDNDIFYSSGKQGNSWRANFALKAGRYWESNIYHSVIKEVVFVPGKSYIVPKAIIEPVITANGAEVTNVPLYNVGVMERYHYIPGETIYFRFGGEQGVTLCDVYGDSVRLI